jgi:starch-binding outer membrane protein, SusD/RagB family
MPVITNAELILIFAEASINVDGDNSADGIAGINAIRDASNLTDYAGATDAASLIDEMLNQRRYSLFMQGHRWIDMRRYDKLDELPMDRVGDVVHTQFPRPFQEIGVSGG